MAGTTLPTIRRNANPPRLAEGMPVLLAKIGALPDPTTVGTLLNTKPPAAT
jgi:hypothetical protein